MRREEVEVLQDIERIEKHQGLLLEKACSSQQQLFQLFAQRRLLSRKMLHKHIDEVLEYLPGSFASCAIQALHLSVCLEMRVQLNPEENPLLRRLVDWSDNYLLLKDQQPVNLRESVLPAGDTSPFRGYEYYLTFLNFIGADLAKLVRSGKGDEEKAGQGPLSALSALSGEDLIVFLLNSLPKILYNIILPNDVLPPEYRQQYNSMEILYKVPSSEYFLRSKSSLATLLRILVKTLVRLELKASEQKSMMEIVFRYFYAYHHDKKYGATDVFVEAFNSLGESVRFAMADEFVMFLKMARKVGKGKFVDFLLQKSQWLQDISALVAENNYVGYAKESLNPFPTLRVFDTFTVPNGKSEHRTFEILQDYSLFYFYIEVPARDITLRLHYLGDFTEKSAYSTQLLYYEKKSGVIKGNIMAVRRGIYQFEFDNTYSWINSKTIHFEKVVLAPVEFQSETDAQWIPSYYDNVPSNSCSGRSPPFLIKKAPLPPKQQLTYDGVANITKENTFYNLKLGKGDDMYEFETENQDKLVKKFNELVDQGGKIRWMIGGEPLEESDDLKKLLGGNTTVRPLPKQGGGEKQQKQGEKEREGGKEKEGEREKGGKEDKKNDKESEKENDKKSDKESEKEEERKRKVGETEEGTEKEISLDEQKVESQRQESLQVKAQLPQQLQEEPESEPKE